MGGMAMHAVVVRVKIDDEDAGLDALRNEVVPQVSQAPGFVAGYWTRKDDTGLSMIVFDSEEAATQASERIPSPVPPGVTFESAEAREVAGRACAGGDVLQRREALFGGVERHPHAVVHVDVDVAAQPPGEERPRGADLLAYEVPVAVVERPVLWQLDRVVARRRSGELEAQHRPLDLLARGVLGLVDADERVLEAGV